MVEGGVGWRTFGIVLLAVLPHNVTVPAVK